MRNQRVSLSEASGSLADLQQTPGAGGRYRALLIRAGWGSSGYYSEAVLRRDGPKIWPAGTQMYVDHPTATESFERPERSVRDFASIIATDPVWDPKQGGLVAEVQVFPQWRQALNEEFAEAVGLSIRAYGAAEQGEAEGRSGQIISELTEGVSVDWVTQAGAGGKVLQLIESARTAPLAEAVSDKPWGDFGQADYDIGQWRKACLIGPDAESETTGDYKLPVREPDGTVNRAGVHAAASALAGSRGGTRATSEQKRKAAKALVSLYGQLKEDPPDSITTLAGAAKESARRRLSEVRNVGQFMEAKIHSHFSGMADDMYGDGKLTRDERIGLSKGIGDGLAAFTETVTADHPQLYARDLWDDPVTPSPMSEAIRRRLREGHGMTANDLCAALAEELNDAYGGNGVFTWVRDNTDDWVVFNLASDGDSDLYQQSYTVDEATGDVTLTGDAVEVAAVTTYKPVPPDADDDQAKPGKPVGESGSKPGSKPAEQEIKEGEMPALNEAEARELTEARDKAMAELTQARAELDAERAKVTETAGVAKRIDDLEAQLQESAARNQRLENDRAARTAVTKALAGSGLPDISHARVTEAVCRSLPTTETGGLEVAKFAEAVTAAIDGEKTYLASYAESAGIGVPRGLTAPAEQLSEADLDAQLEEALRGIGLDEKSARTAAAGR